MSGIPYAAGTIVASTIVSTTVSNVVNNLKDELVNAGWSVVASAADDFTLECVVTPQGLICRVRISADTNCAKISFRDQSEVRIGLNHFLRAGIGDFQVIACQHQFFVLLPGDSTTANSFVAGGVLYVEQSFIWEAIWSQGNGISDTDVGTVRTTFRTASHCYRGPTSPHTWQSFNGFARDGGFGTSAGFKGDQMLLVPMGQGFAAPGFAPITVWYDEAGVGADPASAPARLAWCAPNFSEYASVKGELWGTLLTTAKCNPIDEQVFNVLDGKDWQCITDPAGDPTNDSRGNGNIWTIIAN